MKNTEERVRGIGHTVRHCDFFLKLKKKKEDKVETIGEEIRVHDFPELRYQSSAPWQNK